MRQLLSKQTKKDSVRGSYTSLCDLDSVITGDNNVRLICGVFMLLYALYEMAILQRSSDI